MLTPSQQRVVDAIADGAVDYGDIAEDADMQRTHARKIVRSLCKRYDVPLQRLPAAVEREAAKV